MSERRGAAKGRRLGSSRRKQLREGPGEAPAPAPGPDEEPPWASEIVQRVQQLLSDRDTGQAGVVTRSDMQRLQEEGLPCSREELELVFDGLDAAGTGRLGTEEFTAGLRQFLSSQKAAREHRRRKTASRRVRLVLPGPALPAGDSEERRHFAAFMEQLGTDNLSEEQEIWQLWVKLRQDEPQLLDNLEDFLAKMRHRIQEARSEKEALELTLNKRVAEHDKDVQQLCEVLEQQIQQEQLRLQQQSMSRSHQQDEELQRVLDASEREVQRLVTAQMELERRCHSLQSSQQVTSTENLQLQESNRALQHHLQHLHQQLQQTQGRLKTMRRATVVWEHTVEPGDRVVAELPIEVPMSPQLSPGKSEKFRSEMRIRLGSQSSEGKAKGTHQVVWEMLPAEINISGAPRKASSAEEDPFPEPLKEEGVSDQSSLLREMNDAIAALSKHLKAQAMGAPHALADTPWDNAEPHTGPEAATAHETTPGVLQETLPGHVHHELLEGDLQEGPATAELRALDVTQAGASTGARHCTAQEPGAEQGHSPEEAQGVLFLQGKAAGVEEMVLNVAEHLGESMEAGEQVLMEVEGAGRLQEKTAWAEPQPLGEAEEVEISQREDLEAALGPPEAGQEGTAVGQCLGMDELQPGRTLGECGQAPGTALQEWADPASGLPGELETELGEQLEPEPPSWGEAQVEAAHGGAVPAVTEAPGPGVLDEEDARTEVQPRGETMDSKGLEVLPAWAECAGSSRAGGEEEEVEEAEPGEAEQQLQGECARGGEGWRGSMGALEPLAAAVPPTQGQGGVGTDVELMEAQSSTNMELLAEVEADLQVWNEARSPGTQQGGGVDPGVQLEKDKPEVGLGEEMGAAAVPSEGPSPAVGSTDLCGLSSVKSQALELVEADLQLCGGLSPETPQGGKGERAVQLQENEEEDGAQGQGEDGLPQEPVLDLQGSGVGHSAGGDGDMQAQEEAASLDTIEHQSSGANVELIAEGGELRLTLGGSPEADLQPLGEAGSSGTEQGGSVDSEVHLVDQEDKEEFLEREAEDAQADMMSHEGLSPGAQWRGGGERAVQLEEDGAQGQGEHGLPHKPVLDLQELGVRQGEGAGEDMQAQEEAASLNTIEDQSSGANLELIAEGDELRLAPGGSPEADLQPLGEAGSSGTQQGGSVDSEVQPLDQVNKAELVEGEAEDSQEDTQLSEGLSSGVSWGGEIGTNIQIEEKDDGAQGQGEGELPQEPVHDLQGSGFRQGEGADEGMQAGEEAESLGTIEDQSSGANVELIAEGDELTSASAESTKADLQALSQTDSMGTEQGGNVAPDVHPVDQGDEEELVEREAEDSRTDSQLCVTASPETPHGGGHCAAVQPRDGAGDWGQGQGGHGLMQELVPHSSGVTIRQRRGTDARVQPLEEVVTLDTVEDQSSGASVELIAEGDELRLSPGGSPEADLQPLGEAGSSGTQQGGSVDSEVQPLDQVNKAELVEGEAEDVQEDTQLSEGLSSGVSWGGEIGTNIQIEEKDDGAQGQGEGELPQEPVHDLQGSGVGHSAGGDGDMQAQEEAASLDTIEDQSSGANVELIAEGGELRLTLGGSPEADLQPLGEAGSSGTEQRGSVDSEVHLVDQGDKEEFLEREAEDAQADMMSHEGLSPGAPWGLEGERAVQLEEDGAQGQGEHGLAHEPVLDLQELGVRQGEGAGEDMQAQEEAASLNTIEDQSSGANVELIAEGDELRLSPGGSPEADLQPLGEAGSSGTEQGGSVDSEVQPLDQEDKAKLVEGEAEDVQEDTQLSEGLSSGVSWGGEIGTNIQIEEKDDGAQGQGEGELPQEPVHDLQGSGFRQGEGADEGMQAGEEAESLGTIEDQSSGANVELIAEGDELTSASAESTKADLQALSQTDSMGTEQGGNVAPDVHPVDQGDEEELVEREAEDSRTDSQLCVTASPETPHGGGHCAAVQPRDGAGDWGQGQGGHGLMQELVPHSSGVTIRQRRGTDARVQPLEEVVTLDTVEDQSSGASVELIAEGDELRLSPGGSPEADLQPLGEAGSSGTQQGGSVDSEVQPLDQVNKAELVEGEAEDVQEDTQLSEALSSGVSWGGEIGTNIQIEEKDDGAQGQGEGELPQEPVHDLQGSGVGHSAGGDGDMQAQEEAASLDTIEDQSSGANVELIAEGGELRLTLGGSPEADLQPLGEAGSSGTEQGGSVDSEVQPLDQEDKEKILEGEAEDAQADMMSHEGLSPGAPWRGGGERAVQLEEDGAQGQGEHGLAHEPVLDLQGSEDGHSTGAGEDMQAQEETESLGTIEHQSSGANLELIAEGGELRLSPGGSPEADLQPLGEAGSSGTEQGGSVDSEVQPLEEVNKAELVEGEAEDVQEDTQLSEALSSGVSWGGEIGTNIQIEEKDDGAQGQGEDGLPQEPVLDLQGSGVGHSAGGDGDMQAQEEAASLDTTEHQSSGANVELIAEGGELRLTLGGSPEADLQPLGEAGSSGTEQGGSVDSEVHLVDQEDKEEFLEREAEDAQADMMSHEGLSPGAPWGLEGERAVQLEEDGAQGQGEHGLPHEPVLDLQELGVRQGEGAGEDLQAQEEAASLDTIEHQSNGANVELIAEGDELRLAPGGSPEADLQPLGEAGSSGTQQGGSVDSEVQPLDQVNKAELVEGEAEDSQADLQLSEGLSSGAPWGGEDGRAVQNEEDDEDEAQVQGENGLPQEPVLGPEGARGQQGEGAGGEVQLQQEAESLDTLEAQSTDADVQLFTDQQKPKSGSGGSTEADLTPLDVAGMWEGQQNLTLGLEAVLGASPTANPWEGAAAADVPTPTEAALCPEPVTAAQGPGLEAKLGACIGPEGQILEAQELLQGRRAPAEGKPLDRVHSLEVAQGERLEAGVRSGVKTQGLGLNQGHDDAASASLVSEVPLQISPLKLETMMQEDVLIPGLCAPGQAAQRELQEQVSAQGHEGRLHTEAQQPEGKTPPTMEPEHTAAGPAECPKQEVPPASTLHTTAHPGRAGSDQLGVVLRDNSLGQRQLLGEQSEDLGVGQREKMQEFGQKMRQEGEPSLGDPGAVTAGGAGAALRGSPKAPLEPEHLYNVLFVGDSHVGKTSFLYRLQADTFNPHLAATVGLDYQIKNLEVDNKRFALRLWDSAGQERYRSMTKQFFRKADGVVLMYDITSEYSFSDVRYWLSCIQEAAEDGVAVLLLGNKTDCAAQRRVPTEEGESLAKEHQLMFYECSAASGHNVFESMVSFVRLLKVREDELKNKAEEVPKAPQKKKGCCW